MSTEVGLSERERVEQILAGNGCPACWAWFGADGRCVRCGAGRVAAESNGHDPYAGVPHTAELVLEPEVEVPESERAIRLPILPTRFWESRPELDHIRRAAHQRQRSADVALAGVLARVAAMRSPALSVDTTVGASDASLNFYAAIVGPAGAGKSSALGIARRLLPVPEGLDLREGFSLGTGEGIAEEYMGEVEVPKANGRPGATEKVRRQIRGNALFSLDEGELLTRMRERNGSSVGAVLRTAWVGEDIGQANASAERRRLVPAGSYALGLVIGFQPETAQSLLADGAAGTPQRFCWVAASDPTIPDTPPDPPGALGLTLAELSGGAAMTVCPPVCAEIRAEDLAANRGELVRSALDAHRPLMRIKVAGLLALLARRRSITEDDWALSQIVWDTSCAVRDAVLAQAVQAAAEAAEAKTSAYIDREVRRAAAVAEVPDRVARVAGRIARRVHGAEQEFWSRSVARRDLPSRDRALYDQAVAYAADRGWIAVRTDCLYPGDSVPTDG